jgi:hypothetical protein
MSKRDVSEEDLTRFKFVLRKTGTSENIDPPDGAHFRSVPDDNGAWYLRDEVDDMLRELRRQLTEKEDALNAIRKRYADALTKLDCAEAQLQRAVLAGVKAGIEAQNARLKTTALGWCDATDYHLLNPDQIILKIQTALSVHHADFDPEAIAAKVRL